MVRVKANNVIPAVLSIIVVVIVVWAFTAPENSNNDLRLRLQQAMSRFDFIRYDLRVGLRTNINKSDKANNIIAINIYHPEYMHKASKSIHEYVTLKKVIIKLEQIPNIKIKAITSDIVVSQSKGDLIQELEKLLQEKIHNKPQDLEELTTLDKQFIATLRANKNIIMPIVFTHKNIQDGTLPKPLLRVPNDSPIYNYPGYITNFKEVQSAIKHLGFTTTSINMDNVIRRTPLIIRHQSKVYPSLALAVALNLHNINKIKINEVQLEKQRLLKSIEFNNHIIPVSQRGEIYIPFVSGKSRVKSYTAEDILENKYNPKDLDGSIILITSEANFKSKNPSKYIFSPISEAEAQAAIINSILEDKVLYKPYWSDHFTISTTILIGIIIVTCFRIMSSAASIIILITMQICLTSLNLYLFLCKGIVLSISPPLFIGATLALINVMFGLVFEANKKRHLKKFFVQYVPPEYLDILLENPDAYGFEGKSENLTVLFADIRNFTSISETLDANGVKKLLNELFTPMTRIILKHGGTVDKYVGDMIMAFFGAPIASENHRERALNCALEMLAKTRQMQRRFKAQGLPKIEITISLNSGMMNVGDMGSEFRRSYTVIGDAVNLGSRIQGATVYYGVKLIAGSNTCQNQNKFVFRMLDVVKLKGRNTCETIYEVVGRRKSPRPYVLQEIEQHRKALDAYFDQDWDLAIELFTNLANSYPEFKTYTIFLQRAQNYKQSPPPKNWDGSYTFTEK